MKNRIQSSDGIPIEKLSNDNEDYKEILERFKDKNVSCDTINKKLIYAGNFKATKKDLESMPLFNDNEILSFKQKTSELEISKSAFEKLCKFGSTNSKNGIGIQFVVCINENPTLFGYFFNYSYFVSYFTSTYELAYENPEKEISKKNSYFLNFTDRKYDQSDRLISRKLDSINEMDLFSALKNSNRLK
ncbi:hypothetical protein [Flavobacterium sp. GCM10027622]|uniref:hypothetical protein n=1 Tax=unclassified Flavobacterium TaxID=196869 RepID=UPI003615218F